MYDYALDLYRTGLEDMMDTTMLQELDEALVDLTTGNDDNVLEEGWALKKKKKVVRHSEKAKKFLEGLFNAGAKTGRKMDSAEAERLMIDNDDILPSERLSATQIRSFFSTICRKREKDSARTKRNTEGSEDDGNDMCDMDYQDKEDEEETEDMFDEIGRDVFDIVSDIVRDHRFDLFEKPDEPLFDADV